MKEFQVSVWYLYCTFITLRWCSIVTGQSIVLYSSLHLILSNKKQLRWVLAMIIFDGIICHVPTSVLTWGSNSPNPTSYPFPYSIYEKFQVSVFFLQELVISALCIYHTIRILRPEGRIRGNTPFRVMTHLIYVNILIIILDITILGLEYAGLYDIQTAYKGLVYSVKLKLEFSILSRLVELTKSRVAKDTERSIHLETFDEDEAKRRAIRGDRLAGYMAFVSAELPVGPRK
jgi:hypothetical protein